MTSLVASADRDAGPLDLPRALPARLQLRCLAVSLVTTVIDAGLFAICAALLSGLTTLVWARWACGAVGAICNFTLNRVWAFRARRVLVLPQLGRYGVTALASVSLATLVWWLLRIATGLDVRLLHLLSLGLVWLCFSFPMLRSWVFRPGAPVRVSAARSCGPSPRHVGGGRRRGCGLSPSGGQPR